MRKSPNNQLLNKKKWRELVSDFQNFEIAKNLRSYIQAYEKKVKSIGCIEIQKEEYIKWAKNQIDDFDPLTSLKK